MDFNVILNASPAGVKNGLFIGGIILAIILIYLVKKFWKS
jgi:hypothetical protein